MSVVSVRGVQENEEGCLFALNKEIYGWHPEMSAPKLLAERPGPVTSLTKGSRWFDGRCFSVWDACLDGKIRRDLKDEVLTELEKPVWSVMYLYNDYLDPDYQEAYRRARRQGDCFWSQAPNLPVLLYLSWNGRWKAGPLNFSDSRGRQYGQIPMRNTAPVQAAALESGSVFWVNDSIVYRGLDNRTIDVNFHAGVHTLLLPFGPNYFVCRYSNGYYFPEGVIISARDRRTVLSWDPNKYGFGNCAGIYQHQGQPWLFFYSIGHPEKATIGYTMPFRSPDSRHLPEPRQLFVWPFGLESFGLEDRPADIGSNPFLAVKLKDYGHLFS